MELKKSNIKKRLREGHVCFGSMLRILKSPQAVALYASEGWDYIILDTEHNDYNYETLGNFSLASKYEDITLLIRVPDKEYRQMGQLLDLGADGLVIPQIKKVAEAEQVIQATKYAPIGKRGVSISGVVTRYRDCSQAAYTKWANEEVLTIIQIESQEGIDNINKIASIPGIDAIMVGPADLTQDMGIPGLFNHPKAETAFREVIRQCNKHGVAPGIHLSEMKDVLKWIKEGMRFITYSSDTKFLKDASREALQELKNGQAN